MAKLIDLLLIGDFKSNISHCFILDEWNMIDTRISVILDGGNNQLEVFVYAYLFQNYFSIVESLK